MNRKTINNRRRCAHHRLVARALRDRPGLVDEARVVVRDWKRHPDHATFVEEWERLLSLPIEQLRREITRRTPEADRLRASSPFALIATRVMSTDQRTQLWQKIRPPVHIAHGTS
jgi:hypothetical protein